MEKPVVLAQFSIIQSYCGIRNKLQLINMLLHHFILFFTVSVRWNPPQEPIILS